MLVIRRRAGQSIRIGDNAEIHIVEITPTRVTLAIEAPREVSVTRSELLLIQEQNVASAGSFTAEALAKLAGGLKVVR